MLSWGRRPACSGTARGSSIGINKRNAPALTSLSVRSKAEEPAFLREPVGPVVLGDFPARLVLAVASLHGIDLGQCRAPLRGVARTVTRDNLADEVGALQDYASARRLGRRFPEVAKERRFIHDLKNALAIVDGFPRELDDRTRLYVAV